MKVTVVIFISKTMIYKAILSFWTVSSFPVKCLDVTVTECNFDFLHGCLCACGYM